MHKIIKTFFRRRKAKALGFEFRRVSNFVLPEEITINESSVKLQYPQEEGVFNDFISIFLDDDYGLRSFKLQEIERIIDIGANVGFFSLAARIAFPLSQIHAYEPNSNLSVFLSSYSNTLNVECFTEAIGGEPGIVELELLGDSNQTRIKSSDQGKIKMISLEEALERSGGYTDLLKMDCEGSEWDILKQKDSLKNVKNITLEYHLWKNQQSHAFAKELVKSKGFKILRHKPSTDFGIITAKRQ